MQNHLKVFVVLSLCLVAFQPVCSISRWFTSSFHDLKMTYKRYSNCLGNLPAFKDIKYNETEYLVKQTIVFLDQGTYDNDQLSNISAFMDTICNPNAETYAVSANIYIDSYKNGSGKALRCKAIDDALDSIYYVFKRVATNRSEPLDFSNPKFYANSTMKSSSKSFNLTDLINTSWITSEFSVDMTCNITEPIKDYIANKIKNSKPQGRREIVSDRQSYLGSLMAYLDGLLDNIFGLQRRLYWDGTTIVEHSYSSARSTLSGLISRSSPKSTNSTSSPRSTSSTNSTSSASLTTILNGTNTLVNQSSTLITKPTTISS